MKEKFQNLLEFSKKIFKAETNRIVRRNRFYYKGVTSRRINSCMALFESYHAESTTGNVYAIFEQLCIDKPEIKKYWVYKTDSPLLDEIKKQKNTYLVKYESKRYFKILSTAKYLFNDTSFMPYFIKRKDQIYVNTWHGTPLKTLGLDIITKKLDNHKNIQRNLLATDYLMVPNSFTAEKLIKSHQLDGIFPGKVFATGNPRMDLNKKDRNEMKRKYSLDFNKKIILFAPTWKKNVDETTDLDIENLIKQVEDLQASVSVDTLVLLKSHYFIYSRFVERGLANKVVPTWVDTNELLTTVDGLITDYSSIFFDFLPFNKPIYFYMEDLSYYENFRGLYLDINGLPGDVYYSIDSLVNGLKVNNQDYLARNQSKIDTYLEEYCSFDDGESSKRIIDIVFDNSSDKNELFFSSKKEILLFYAGGFYDNGITSSFLNLTNRIDYDKYEVVVLEYPNSSSMIKQKNISKLNQHVKIIYKFSYIPHSFFDGLANSLLFRRGYGGKFVNANRVRKYHEMDRIRTLGNLAPDFYIDFGGYNKSITSLFALSNNNKKIIFLHNLMKAEYDKIVKKRFVHRWNLKVIFSLYNQFDKIVSVSDSANEQNKIEIKQVQPNLDTTKMDFVENTIDGDAILRSINRIKLLNESFSIPKQIVIDSEQKNKVEILSIVPKPLEEDINFVTVARLSPEKNHKNIINAFSNIVKTYKNAKLHLIGTGPEKGNLEHQVSMMGLEENIYFYNHLNNPFYFVEKCDCFVLFSDYEGQGLSLIESMIIGVPVVGTDVSGICSVLEKSEQNLLVPCTIEGITSGFQAFIDGKIKAEPFNYQKYNEKAYQQFENLLK